MTKLHSQLINQRYAPEAATVMILGTNAEMKAERKVNPEDVDALMSELSKVERPGGIHHVQISSKTGTNVRYKHIA